MKDKKSGNAPFLIAVAAVVTVTCAVILTAVCSAGKKLNFSAVFYFVCYSVEDNAVSADSLSSALESFGGAGYVLEYGGEFYVTASCYYSQSDADKVKGSLLKKGLNCSTLKAESKSYEVSSIFGGNAQLYEGNLNTLFSLSEMCYECANGLDTGEYGAEKAKSALDGVKSALKGLERANPSNCFSGELKRLCAECESVESGHVRAFSMRKLQIAIADTILNVDIA